MRQTTFGHEKNVFSSFSAHGNSLLQGCRSTTGPSFLFDTPIWYGAERHQCEDVSVCWRWTRSAGTGRDALAWPWTEQVSFRRAPAKPGKKTLADFMKPKKGRGQVSFRDVPIYILFFFDLRRRRRGCASTKRHLTSAETSMTVKLPTKDPPSEAQPSFPTCTQRKLGNQSFRLWPSHLRREGHILFSTF